MKMVPLQSLVSKVSQSAGEDKYPVLSITAGVGFVKQTEKFGKEIAGAQYVHYTVLKKGDFSYNKGNSKTCPQGCIYRQDDYEYAAVPNVFNSFRFVSPDCDTTYYKYLFESGYLNRQLSQMINSGVRNDGLLNIYDEDFYGCKVPCPPLEEQKRIAEILECCDRVIRLKREVIEEKKKQKKSLMQKLLNPDRDFLLPGFKGNWKKASLGELCLTFSGGTPSRDNGDYYGGTIPWLKSGELNSRIIVKTEEHITPLALDSSSTKMVKAGTLLLALYGATAGVIAITKIDVAINQAILAIENSDVIDSNYLYYSLLNQIDIAKNKFTQGGQPNFNAGIIRLLIIDYPEKAEQQAIATILSSADHELDLLEHDLTQWEQKKKSLMQLLLTGKVRV